MIDDTRYLYIFLKLYKISLQTNIPAGIINAQGIIKEAIATVMAAAVAAVAAAAGVAVAVAFAAPPPACAFVALAAASLCCQLQLQLQLQLLPVAVVAIAICTPKLRQLGNAHCLPVASWQLGPLALQATFAT